jgi:3-deoxy-7-phosphoheptulonate synthase
VATGPKQIPDTIGAPPGWSPESWKSKPASQQPVYDDQAEVERVLAEIAALPPLVTSWEVNALKSQLADAQRGERFLLQGGDCAESFDCCSSQNIAAKLKVLLQMSLVVVHGGRKPVIRVGRFCGQYAKPRSADLETRNGLTLPSYRGDLINRSEFTAPARRPDPQLLLRGYERAALTLNFIRALVNRGFVDPHRLDYWDLDFVKHSPMAEEYHRRARSVGESLRFMENILGVHPGELRWIDFFTSHEGLHLAYEQAQTRRVPRHEGWYNLSTHFPWIGMRTAEVVGAHVEYFRGLRNPIGLKVGPSLTPDKLLVLIDALQPEPEPGRLTFIHRFGNDAVGRCLPPLIEAVKSLGKPVLWCCDPMHGNTRNTINGRKTRNFGDILGELRQSFDIHQAAGTHLGGVHIELTGEDVTECIGGARGLSEDDLHKAYTTHLDPRLNYEQALEVALFIADRMSRQP